MIAISPILPALAAHAGLALEDVLEPLRAEFILHRGMPRDFRSTGKEPSSAGGMKTLAKQIKFPKGMPYIAGTTCGDDVRLSGAEIAPGVLWYGEMTEAKLVLKNTTLPLSMLGGLHGRRIGEVVGHPALANLEDEIVAVIDNGGHITFHMTMHMMRIADPLPHMKTPRADWARDLRAMEEEQGLHERTAA